MRDLVTPNFDGASVRVVRREGEPWSWPPKPCASWSTSIQRDAGILLGRRAVGGHFQSDARSPRLPLAVAGRPLLSGVGCVDSLPSNTGENCGQCARRCRNIAHDQRAGAGQGALIKQGSGRFTLTGTNTYTGGTWVQAGTLAVNGNTALGANSGALTLAGGTLQADADMSLPADRSVHIGSGRQAAAARSTPRPTP